MECSGEASQRKLTSIDIKLYAMCSMYRYLVFKVFYAFGCSKACPIKRAPATLWWACKPSWGMGMYKVCWCGGDGGCTMDEHFFYACGNTDHQWYDDHSWRRWENSQSHWRYGWDQTASSCPDMETRRVLGEAEDRWNAAKFLPSLKLT